MISSRGGRTRKSHKSDKTDKEKGIFTIPELRISFEHIEDMTADLIKKKVPDNEIITQLVEEWQKTFYRKLDKDSAKAYIEYVREEVRMGRRGRKVSSRTDTRKNRRQNGGGAQDATSPSMSLLGAPLDYVTRAGIYPPAGDIPPNAYGKTWAYVDNNFNVAVPEQGYKVDQLPFSEPRLYPTAPEQSGKIGLSGGRRRRSLRISRKKTRASRRQKGGAPSWFPQPLIGSPLPRAFESSAPPSLQYTAMIAFSGQPTQNLSPDPSQNNLKYLMGPRAEIPYLEVSKIPINLKQDIRVN
ncbi:hypothetical protein EB118_24965 [bacterium]|nr:hypothetical protein [bacterium]